MRGGGWRARRFREVLPRLALLKAGRGLDAGASVIEIDGGKVQVTFIESGFEARNFGTEPAGDVTVGVNGNADLTLLDDGMNLNRAEGVGAHANMHLGGGAGIGGDGRGRRSRRRGRRGVKHLVGLRKRRCGTGCDLGWRGGSWRSGRG